MRLRTLLSIPLLAVLSFGSPAQESARAEEAPLVVFVTGDEEYRSEESMPMLARILERDHDVRVACAYSVAEDGTVDPNESVRMVGLEAVEEADLVVLFTRFRRWEEADAKRLVDYAASGKPLVGFRTSTHAFKYPDDHPLRHLNDEWSRAVFGQRWITHHGHFDDGKKPLTAVTLTPAKEVHPILRGVEPFGAFSWLYHVEGGGDTLEGEDVRRLLWGSAQRSGHVDRGRDGRFAPVNPVAWTKTSPAGGRVFFTTLGHPFDFRAESMRRVSIQGILWALGAEDEIPAEGVPAAFASPYDPRPSGFGSVFRPGQRPELVRGG